MSKGLPERPCRPGTHRFKVEHVPMAEQLMDEAFRVLRSGGLLLLSTPSAVWWQERPRLYIVGRKP